MQSLPYANRLNSWLDEYIALYVRYFPMGGWRHGQCLTEIIADPVDRSNYSFFDPELRPRTIGNHLGTDPCDMWCETGLWAGR